MGETARFVIELDVEEVGDGLSLVASIRSDPGPGIVTSIGWTAKQRRLPRTVFELAELMANARRRRAAPEVRHG